MTREASALAAANEIFRQEYARARAAASNDGSLLIVLASELALHVAEQRRTYAVSHPPFDVVKVAAHIAVGLYTTTLDTSHGLVRAEMAGRLESIRSGIGAMLSDLKQGKCGPTELRGELAELLELSGAYTERALAEPDACASCGAEFARASGRHILRLTQTATRGQIAALHEAVEQALSSLTSEQRMALQVVVVGDHQARARSLGMQYFRRRFREREGSDERVTYGENVTSEEEAISLVATRRLDREIARAFFDDEKRLQRDVLGDAAKECLDELELPPIA